MRANRIGRVIGGAVGVFACVLMAHTGSGALVQGFEAGDPALTGSTGDASVQTSFEGQPAPQGSNQYLLTSLTGIADNDGVTDVSGTSAVSNSALQAFFFNQVTLTGLQGSGVLIPFSVVTGDTTMTFQYDFLSNQPEQTTPKNDFAFEAIFDSTNTRVQGGTGGTRFAQVSGTSFTLFDTNPFIDHTGYQTFTIDISGLAPGDYNLGIGVEALSGGSNQHNSGVLIDNIQIVPEPTTVAFSIAGGVLLMALRGRFKKAS